MAGRNRKLDREGLLVGKGPRKPEAIQYAADCFFSEALAEGSGDA
jgi:hypothetical protein